MTFADDSLTWPCRLDRYGPMPISWSAASRLRAKLGDPPVIETVPKAGYRISQ